MPLSQAFHEVLEEGEIFFPFSKWPPIAKDYMVKNQKARNERYYLMRFLCYNGLRPEIASHWIMREGVYDDDAKRDQIGLVAKAQNVEFYRKGRIFNMRLGRTDTAEEQPYPSTAPPPLSMNPTKAPTVTVTWEKVLDMYPRPTRSQIPDDFEFQLALLTWKEETRRAIDKWKSQGLIMEF